MVSCSLLLRLALILPAIAVMLAAVSSPAPVAAQVADPVPGPIPVSSAEVLVTEVVTLPDSGSASRPKARPMLLTGDGTGRRFVADQNGTVYQIHADDSFSIFLDLTSVTDLFADQRQRGLSAFAFHPDHATPGAPGLGKFYTASSQDATLTPDYPVPAGAVETHHAVVHEWEVDANDPNAIDPSSAREILRVGQPFNDHGIGQIGFDPSLDPNDPDYGLLYIAMGDGGNVCCPRPSVDPFFQGQDLASPLGALLRIDPLENGPDPYSIPLSNVLAADGDPNTLGEIWAYGLRNPHRFAFDTGGSGALLISDIGQANVEEIVLGANDANFGWSEREGTFLVEHVNEDDVFPLPVDDAIYGYTYPVLQYDHDEGDRAISGGYVYRGSEVPVLAGRYVFGDLVSGRVFIAEAADLDGSGVESFAQLRLIDAADGTEKSLLDMIGGVSRTDLRFGMDDAGELYLLTKQDGTIRRLPEPAALLQLASGAILLAGLSTPRRRR